MEVRVSNWGNSLGVRLPKAIVDELGLAAGQSVQLELQDKTVVLRPAMTRRERLLALLKQIDPENIPESFDDGPVGSELL